MFDINYEDKSEEIISWLKDTVYSAGFKDVIIALSGGIDSAVSVAVSVKAFGKEHVNIMLLPYGSLNDEGIKHAKLVAEFLKLPKKNIYEIDIKSTVSTFLKTNKKQDPEKIRIGNIMARVRMIYLYDFAKKINALVVGTENKSEYYLGYFTRFGDEASDIEPIRGLYKTQIWNLGKFLNIPKEIIEKEPTAGLWEGQSDEKEFGFSYKDADRILYHHFEESLPIEAIIDLGINKEIVRKVLNWVEKNDFKHKLPKVFG